MDSVLARSGERFEYLAMIAYVDESLRLDGEGRYVLAAVLVPDARADEVRTVLRDAVPRGLRRFHFRKQGDSARLAMCVRIARLGLDAVVVVAPRIDARAERTRRLCLTRLLWELGELEVHDLVIESRHAADKADRRLIASVERAGWTSDVRYAFGQPDDECLLWLADVVAGAVARAVGDSDPKYVNALGSTVTVVELP